ncbi:MAG: hypothetical protein HY332_07620, partial [Chloroflexi bacterium]|nr:hypothetical protein [Chloroflexota bacterium]
MVATEDTVEAGQVSEATQTAVQLGTPSEQKQTPQTASDERRRISAFFPCFNDAGTIASMVLEALVVLRELAGEYEVIVIENGSTDYA